jgi:hypothetical protein
MLNQAFKADFCKNILKWRLITALAYIISYIWVKLSIFIMRITVLLLCFFYSVAAFGQQQQVRYDNNYVPPTKAQLEAKRKEIQDAINETEHQLDDIK